MVATTVTVSMSVETMTNGNGVMVDVTTVTVAGDAVLAALDVTVTVLVGPGASHEQKLLTRELAILRVDASCAQGFVTARRTGPATTVMVVKAVTRVD